MVIAVNTRFLIKDQLDEFGYFTKEVFSRLTTQHPDHQFYFLFDRPFNSEYIFSKNITPHILKPAANHPLLWKYWFDLKVPLVLNKIKADVFVSTDGFCSLNTRVPQCMVLKDLGFIHHPEAYTKSHLLYYNRYTPKFLIKAKRTISASAFSKQAVIDKYKIDAEKIDVVYSAARDNFRPIDVQHQLRVKEKYTEGKEYFIYAGPIQPGKNIINLFKAFSIFKKRQQSNMKLVLAGRLAWENDEFLKIYNTYKYKDDVVLTGYILEDDLKELVAGAYALVYPSLFEGIGIPVLEAMQCAVPALTVNSSPMQDIAEGAALYFDPNNPQDIADKLMLIYKDEILRNTLIEKGSSVVKKYNWQNTSDLMWKSILQAANI